MNDQDTIEHLLVMCEGTANMLRGMTLDPAIPAHTKDAIWKKIAELECIVERYI